MPDQYSVAIIGAGPTGLVLANLLGKAGVRTLLVEANPATVGEPRAVSIDDESLRVAQAMELDDIVRSEVVSGYGSEYLAPDRSIFLKVKPTTQPYGHPRRNAFRQPIFEAQLRQGLTRYANVEAIFECKAESFVEKATHVALNLRMRDGAIREIQADYLVGCDGAWSPTRQALGFSLQGDSLDERWLIIDLEDSPSASPETVVYCDPKRPGILLPGPRNTRRYEFKLLDGETDEAILADDAIAALLDMHDVVPGSRIIRKTVYHFHARIADHWGRDRVWLAGDAAHLMPPFAGQGMNGGIRDAANLAWKLAAVASGDVGPRLLQTYERERRGHVKQMIQLALRMGAIFGPRTPLHGLVTRSCFRLLGLWPAAKSYFAEMRYKPAPRFDGGFLLTSQLTTRGVVGRMLPQPIVSRGADRVRLDDLLGDGFALIGVDIDAETVRSVPLGARWNGLVRHRLSLSFSDVPEFAEHRGKLLLLRPDRYVMARFDPERTAETVAELDALLSDTWSARTTPQAPPMAQAVELRVR